MYIVLQKLADSGCTIFSCNPLGTHRREREKERQYLVYCLATQIQESRKISLLYSSIDSSNCNREPITMVYS